MCYKIFFKKLEDEMILGIIRKANNYASEVQFANIVREQQAHFVQSGRSVGDQLNIGKTFNLLQDPEYVDAQIALKKAALHEDVMSLSTSGILSPSFCELLCDILVELVGKGIQIQYDNCYSKLVRPLLDSCEPEDITVENLNGLLKEIGLDHIKSIVSHPNVRDAGISRKDIESSIKLDEEQALVAAELDAELGVSSAGSDEPSDPLDSDYKKNIFAGASPFCNELSEPFAKRTCYDGSKDPFMGACFDPLSLLCSESLDF